MDARLTLVLIRHAIAEDRAEFARTGHGDDQRPLTDEGRRRMRLAAAGLRAVLPELDLLASSPLVRAWETAEIVSDAYGGLPVDRLDAAASGDGDELLRVLRATEPGTTIAVVGHEPTHGDWTGWLLTGRAAGFVRYKKGEACALEFSGDVRPGAAELLWKLRPRHLCGIEGRAI
jgi:phosphohistidine phosphatase